MDHQERIKKIKYNKRRDEIKRKKKKEQPSEKEHLMLHEKFFTMTV